jgi:hypothetical protein
MRREEGAINVSQVFCLQAPFWHKNSSHVGLPERILVLSRRSMMTASNVSKDETYVRLCGCCDVGLKDGCAQTVARFMIQLSPYGYSRVQNSWHFATPNFELDALSS